MNESRSWMLGLLLAGAPFVAQAHTHLKSATPADGSTLASSPPSIMLMFSEPTRVTALTVQRGKEGAERKLAPLPDGASEHVVVPAPKLEPGVYTVKWRAIGKDNHVMSGVLHFTLTP